MKRIYRELCMRVCIIIIINNFLEKEFSLGNGLANGLAIITCIYYWKIFNYRKEEKEENLSIYHDI